MNNMTEYELVQMRNRSLLKTLLRELLLEIRLEDDLEKAEKLYKIAKDYDDNLEKANEQTKKED